MELIEIFKTLRIPSICSTWSQISAKCQDSDNLFDLQMSTYLEIVNFVVSIS